MKQKTWILHRRNWDNYDHMKKKIKIHLHFRKMQIKHYHITTTIVNIISKYLCSCGETGILMPCWQKCIMLQLVWIIVWHFLIKLSIHLLIL